MSHLKICFDLPDTIHPYAYLTCSQLLINQHMQLYPPFFSSLAAMLQFWKEPKQIPSVLLGPFNHLRVTLPSPCTFPICYFTTEDVWPQMATYTPSLSVPFGNIYGTVFKCDITSGQCLITATCLKPHGQCAVQAISINGSITYLATTCPVWVHWLTPKMSHATGKYRCVSRYSLECIRLGTCHLYIFF